MATQVRVKTGQTCPRSGVYRFDGYLDGTMVPTPTPSEQTIPLAETNIAPLIRSTNKACWWLLIRLA